MVLFRAALRVCFFLVFMSHFSVSVIFAAYDYEYNARGQFESETAAKFQRGVTNAGLGWMEIFQTPVRWGKSPTRSALSAAVIGFPYGIFRAIGRTLVGVYEVATAYAPQKPIFAELEGDVY